jgi:DNA-directed RNA polymerase subunit M/transcription elongation factor TFIIS
MIQFVHNYDDLSTDRGYQFKFYCDKCGNGYLSHFEASVIGTAGSFLRAASSFLGGWGSSAGDSAYEIQRAVGGKAHDGALAKAVEEGKQHFHQCSRCGKWVCPEVCWNEGAGQCEECAPRYEEEAASAHAHAKAEAMREQMYDKARATDYVSNVDMKAGAVQRAPQARPSGASVCPQCGTCATAKFCPECGSSMTAAVTCRGCGHELQTPAKFCPECGGRIAVRGR